MPCKVVLERPIPPHEPHLYQAPAADNGVQGWAAVHRDAMERFARHGYLIIRSGLGVAEITAAREELSAMTLAADPQCASIYYESTISALLREPSDHFGGSEGSHSPSLGKLALGAIVSELPDLDRAVRARYVRKFMGFLSHHPPLHAVAMKAPLIELIERLVGERVYVFQDMAMIKPPSGREKPWHQDHAYFNLPLDAKVIGVWIALDDVTTENGCMYVEPGGHLAGPRPHFMRRDWQLCDSEITHHQTVALPMQAGDVLLFDSKLPHGTPRNTTDSYRWALQFHYAPTDVAEGDDAGRLAAFGSEGKGVSC